MASCNVCGDVTCSRMHWHVAGDITETLAWWSTWAPSGQMRYGTRTADAVLSGTPASTAKLVAASRTCSCSNWKQMGSHHQYTDACRLRISVHPSSATQHAVRKCNSLCGNAVVADTYDFAPFAVTAMCSFERRMFQSCWGLALGSLARCCFLLCHPPCR